MRTLCLWVSLMVLGWSSGAGAVPIQWTVAEGGNGHFYEAIQLASHISWEDAKLQAELAGGYLATITSAEEDVWVRANLLPLITGTGAIGEFGPWLGGYQETSSPCFSEPSGAWTWITGEPWVYTAWCCSEPNNGPSFGGPENQLMYLLDISGVSGWNDDGNPTHGSTITSYLIETTPVPEPSTALLLGLGLVGMAIRKRR